MNTKRNPETLPVTLKLCSVYIRKLRTKYGLSLSDLSKLTGYATTHISAIEHARFMPGLAFIVSMTRAFGVSADWLLGISKHDINTDTLVESEDMILNGNGTGSSILRKSSIYKKIVSRVCNYNHQTRKDILVYASILNTGDEKFIQKTN